MSIAYNEYMSLFYLVNVYTLQILDFNTPHQYHSSTATTMAFRVTATTMNEGAPPTTTNIKPESIVEVQGKTYLNLQPLNNLPSFPVAFTPAAMEMDGFLPIEPDNAFQQGYADGMANITNALSTWPFQAPGSAAATEQCRQWLQACRPAKRPATKPSPRD